ncbi:MAG: formylglycine-generating enzyme family protein [Planctomycetota bacterium]|jgi:formylglycine-generating enzyme required for sulfatase activity
MKKSDFAIGLSTIILLVLLTPESKIEADEPGMVLVPAGTFTFRVEYRWREGLTLDSLIIDDAGTRYRHTEQVDLAGFYIDKTEVTNEQYKQFLENSGYKPKWPKNFLKHWKNGTYPGGRAKHPVVWVSIDDAKAYAEWAGKRLASEEEWQKAAQGTDGRSWPWGNLYDPAKANMDSKDTKPVGSYPQGASPHGALDMTGNVWEMTDSFQSDGYHYFSWLRGGSYFFAKGSRWYMQGGPIASYQRTKYWLMTPELNRSPSIGFRCVKDAE